MSAREFLPPFAVPFALGAGAPSLSSLALGSATPGGTPASGPAFVTMVNDPAQSMAGVSLAVIDKLLTDAQLAGTADVNLINAQAGRIIWPLYAWVKLTSTAVAPSAGKTGSICFPSSAGNSHTGLLCTGVGNQTQVRTWDAAEANLGTVAQATNVPLVLRSTSAAITTNGATCRLWVVCLLVTP